MKINMSQKLRTLEGEPIKKIIQKGKKTIEKEWTLADVLIDSLLANEGAEKTEGAEKMERYILAQRITRNKEKAVELKIEDISKIKQLVGKLFGTLIVGQVWDILEKNKK